jgi:hypothetical protein
MALAREGVEVACAARATDADPLRLPGTIDTTVRQIIDTGGRALAVPTNLTLWLAVDNGVEGFYINGVLGTASVNAEGTANRWEHVEEGRLAVKDKRNVLLDALETEFGGVPGMHWSRPDGGKAKGAILNVVSPPRHVHPRAHGLWHVQDRSRAPHRVTGRAARRRPDRVNTFPIDLPVRRRASWPICPTSTIPTGSRPGPGRGHRLMLGQPPSYTGHNVGMRRAVRRRGDHGLPSPLAGQIGTPHALRRGSTKGVTR